jgi:hypothetical protein
MEWTERYEGRFDQTPRKFLDTIEDLIRRTGRHRAFRSGRYFQLGLENPPHLPLVIECWVEGRTRFLAVYRHIGEGDGIPEVELTEHGRISDRVRTEEPQEIEQFLEVWAKELRHYRYDKVAHQRRVVDRHREGVRQSRYLRTQVITEDLESW